jgi:5-methylcytosine-specific restriction protein A
MHEDIRDQITREDLLEAIASLDRGEAHAFGPSTFYDLLEGQRRYPPKAIVGLAARRALGRSLRPDEFSGGQESWAFRLLRERGFTIVNKEWGSDGRELPSAPPLYVWPIQQRSATGRFLTLKKTSRGVR